MTTHYRAIGFVFVGDRPAFSDPQEHLDFLGKQWVRTDLEIDLTGGVLPEGLVILPVHPDGIPGVIVRDGRKNDVVPLRDMIDVLWLDIIGQREVAR